MASLQQIITGSLSNMTNSAKAKSGKPKLLILILVILALIACGAAGYIVFQK